ncbi:hypothetical protein H7097_00720 [Aeromicrobium sp.]|nr:hypothetical protein [Candidatus Saccharibacteria bacterium]
MLFRRMNEKVGDDLGALDASYIEDKEIYMIRDADLLINFKCECSDKSCSIRIPLKLSEYQDIHVNRDTFIVIPDHQVDPIEKVINSGSKFNVVMKNNSTPAPAKGKQLHDTTIDNSRADG